MGGQGVLNLARMKVHWNEGLNPRLTQILAISEDWHEDECDNGGIVTWARKEG